MALPGIGSRDLRPGRRRGRGPDADRGTGTRPPARRAPAARGAARNGRGTGRHRAAAEPARQPDRDVHEGGRGARQRRFPARLPGTAPARSAAPARRGGAAGGDRRRGERRRCAAGVRDRPAPGLRGPAARAGPRAGARDRRLRLAAPRVGARAPGAGRRGIAFRPPAGRTRGGRRRGRPRGRGDPPVDGPRPRGLVLRSGGACDRALGRRRPFRRRAACGRRRAGGAGARAPRRLPGPWRRARTAGRPSAARPSGCGCRSPR